MSRRNSRRRRIETLAPTPVRDRRNVACALDGARIVANMLLSGARTRDGSSVTKAGRSFRMELSGVSVMEMSSSRRDVRRDS